MKLATQDRKAFGESYQDKLKTIQAVGFEGLEIDGKSLIERFDEVNKAVKATGVPISSVCGGYRGWIGDFNKNKREEAVQDIGEILKYTGEIGASGIVVPAAFGMFSRKLPPFTPPRNQEEELEDILDSLQKINEFAKVSGSFLLLEPLNRYEDHMINRVQDAVRLIKMGDFTHIKIIADFFHMNIEEADIRESLLEAKNLIHHIHLADSNRLQPGLGHIDFKTGFDALKEMEYQGFMAVECGISGEVKEAYMNMAKYLKSCM